MDNVSNEVRSRTMRAVRGRNTSPELALRRAMRSLGLRGYRVSPRSVAGVPDIAYVGLHLAVFADGCFWHGCPDHCRRPSSNTGYWHGKLAKNVARDQQTNTVLRAKGWTVLRFWEHEVAKDPEGAARQVSAMVRTLQARTTHSAPKVTP